MGLNNNRNGSPRRLAVTTAIFDNLLPFGNPKAILYLQITALVVFYGVKLTPKMAGSDPRYENDS